MKKALLKGTDLRKTFSRGGKNTLVLDGVNVEVRERDFTVVMGPSGAGKSTLLYCLSGMDCLTGGEVAYR